MRNTIIFFFCLIIGYAGYYIYKMPKFSDGESAPSFSSKLFDGSDFKLEDLNGQYVLLDFWGSWCGPCRRESPDLVTLYNDYHGKSFSDAKGFEILSVAIETKEANWRRAIIVDKLNWKYHIVQTDRFSGPIATQYGVKEIPTKYFLDTNGEILMVNPSFAEIREFLNEKQT